MPVSFLAVPAGSTFDFHVVCHATRLPTHLQTTWRELLNRAFQHGFEWVGFGAKTSVGYGAMAVKQGGGTTSGVTSDTANTAPAVASASTTDTVVWPAATLTLNKSTGEIKASFEGKLTAGLKGEDAKNLQAALGEERASKLKNKQELKNVAVTIEKQGNSLLLKGLAST